jgi:uncharacterized protein (DUF2225 family)
MVRNIFIEKNVICPACKAGISMKYPNPKLYAAAGRDEDQRVTSYSWAGGIETDVLPHHHAVFQCPNCLLADMKESFETHGRGAKEIALYEAVRNSPFEKRMMLRKLRRFVPQEINLQGALALHLAAIYTMMLPDEKEKIDHLKLGRLYLRLSWLYKEQQGRGEKQAADETAAATASTAGKLLLTVKQFQQVMNQVCSENVEQIQALANARTAEMKFPPGQNPYEKLMAAVREKMTQMQQAVLNLQNAAVQDSKGKLTQAAMAGTAGEMSFEQFLPTLLPQWPHLPRTERDTVKLAVEAFDYSARFEDADQSLQQSMGLTNLVIKLLLKIGDLDRALAYVMGIFKTGYRDKQNLTMKLNQLKREKTPNAFEEQSLTKQIGTVSRTLTMAVENRRKIVGMIFERDKEKIIAVIKQNAEASPEEQEQALVAAGFTAELVPWLRESGIIKQEETKKKWFGKK